MKVPVIILTLVLTHLAQAQLHRNMHRKFHSSTPKFPETQATSPYSDVVSSAVPKSSPSPYTSSNGGSDGSGVTTNGISSNGKKAGLSGYVGIQKRPAFSALAPYIGWYSDYSPTTPTSQNVNGIPMLWGAAGSSCGTTSSRLADYKTVVNTDAPKIMFGFYEPDCSCEMSSDMSVDSAVEAWKSLIAPLATEHGTILGSPSMCKQSDEDFLTPFHEGISPSTWDVTSIHINKPDIAGVKEVVEHYRKYGKPIFVSEFACVHDSPSWQPCEDQGEVDELIYAAVEYFESQDDVVAYGPSNGAGLGDCWPLTEQESGELSKTGRTYLDAIMRL